MCKCNIVVEHTNNESDLYFGCTKLSATERAIMFTCPRGDDKYDVRYITLSDDTIRHIVIDMYNEKE